MLAAAVGLMAFSVFTLESASRHEIAADPHYFVVRQSLYGVIGIALMIGISHIDYTRLRELRVSIYAVMVGSIGLVLLVGTAVRGSNRWIDLPLFQFQPSSSPGPALRIALGLRLRAGQATFGLRQTVGLLAIGLVPAGLVFLQPDLGTGIVLVAITLTILFVSGIPWQHFAAIGAAAALPAGGAYLGGQALGVHPLQGYQQDRLTSFLHPSNDPGDASYQVNQAIIAVGSGEKSGRGDDATQTELLFLPERHTDFIFAVIGERFGFLGAAFLVFLYALLFWRAIRVMRIATSYFGVLIAGGIVAMLAFQAVINLGMNLGLMPVTGITLPLISYGGSSVLGTFWRSLLQAIRARCDGAAQPPPFDARAALAATRLKVFQVLLRLGATLGSLEGSPQARA